MKTMLRGVLFVLLLTGLAAGCGEKKAGDENKAGDEKKTEKKEEGKKDEAKEEVSPCEQAAEKVKGCLEEGCKGDPATLAMLCEDQSKLTSEALKTCTPRCAKMMKKNVLVDQDCKKTVVRFENTLSLACEQ